MAKTNLQCKLKITSDRKIVTFNASALPDVCKAFGIPFDPDIVAFTKAGAIKGHDIFTIIKLADLVK